MPPGSKVYFVGIGGIGMSALARYFKSQNWVVFGSDAVESAITRSLAKEGVKVKIGQKTAILPPLLDLVVISQAIPADHSELRAARRRKIPILTYPEMVARLTEQYETIAVAGAHGKSTTTSLAALALVRAHRDPTVIVGTNLKEFAGKNFRAGRGSCLVLEADEFGNAFKEYSPALAIVTNIDREHLDVYKTLANVKKAFLGFLGNVGVGGVFILNRDDVNLHSLAPQIVRIARQKKIMVIWYSLRDPAAKKIARVIRIPGRHNVQNALAVYCLGQALGLPERAVLSAIGAYRGAWRRMELRGTWKGAPVYDDYAHHPTEIRATLSAFREKYPKKRILCVFQPHQAKRLEALFSDFTKAFDGADAALILPTYKVNGRDGAAKAGGKKKNRQPSRDAEALVRAIQKKQPKKLLFYLADPRSLKKALVALGNPLSSAVIVMMGAGDIVDLTKTLV